MIDRELQPIDIFHAITYEEAAQAFAFTYLAQSNAEAMAARVVTAYKRAWGCDQIIRFERKDNGTPGFMVAIWTTGGKKRLLIAIEGTTEASQIINISSATGWTSRVGILGYVMANFKTKADDIYTQVAEHASTSAIFADFNTIITWTGHSLGAAIADINAVRQKKEHTSVHIRLIKFGAPCVGNDSYVMNSQNLLPRANYYVNRDPIFMVPTAEVRHLNIALIVLDSGPVRDPNCERLAVRGRQTSPGYHRYPGTYTRLHLAADAARTIDAVNPWFDHMPSAYRYAFMELARSYDDQLAYRFCFLEHNFENGWQFSYLNNLTNFTEWNVVYDTQFGFEQSPTGAAVAQFANEPDPEFPPEERGEASIPAPALNQERVPVMQPLAGVVADFGTPTPAAEVSDLRGRRIRHVIP